MDIAALILWILTAGGGFYLLATWIAKGGTRPAPAGGSKFPPALIFGHFLLAVAGLIVWIIYVVNDKTALAWAAFVILAVVALLGFTMLARWIPSYRARTPVAATTGLGSAAPAGAASAPAAGPAESHFPVAIVAGHGLLAATTLVLVLLTALGVGGS
jgi:hypothetical protein